MSISSITPSELFDCGLGLKDFLNMGLVDPLYACAGVNHLDFSPVMLLKVMPIQKIFHPID